MNSVIYWLWLQRVLGEGAFFKSLLAHFGTPEGVYRAAQAERKSSGLFSSKQLERAASVSLDDCTKIIYQCRAHGWQILPFDAPDYPEKLKNIYNPPCVLYIDGTLPPVDGLCTLAVVGTRKASGYALQVANLLCSGAASAGAVVISGGALGVDSAAHTGAITAGGKTICVLGCGLGAKYLYANRLLRESVRANGALVTEFPPYTQAARFTFPMRNRIISGLSDGVVVVEAGQKSGSLITARFAAEQGRDVYAVPSSIIDAQYSGTNQLLGDGAMLVTQPNDLISPYLQRYPYLQGHEVPDFQQMLARSGRRNANSDFSAESQKETAFENTQKSRSENAARAEKVQALSGDLQAVYAQLGSDYEHVDVISERCHLPSGRVLSALSILEIQELALSASGKRYKKL